MIRRTRPKTELPARLAALTQAADLGQDRLKNQSINDARDLADKGTERLRHGTETTLVAMVGATGSGKSSLTNMLVGQEIANSGVKRPTTSQTLACVFGETDSGPILDWLQVEHRHTVSRHNNQDPKQDSEAADLDGLVLLDVPDFDSVESSHRDEMERIAELVDVLVWVTDPQKYADKSLHSYLRGLAGHGAVMAVALNKIDLLRAEEIVLCQDDLRRLLNLAGLDAPVLAVSSLTGDGKADLEGFLATSVASKRAAIDRLSADVDKVATELQDQLGPNTGPNEVPDNVRTRLRDDLLAVSGIEIVSDAVAAGYRRDAARHVGWPFTRWARVLRPHPLRRFRLGKDTTGRTSLPQPSGIERARINGALRTASDAVTTDLPQPWPHHVLEAATPDEAILADRIDQAVAASVRDATWRDPRWWGIADVAQTGLALAAVAGGVWLGLLALAAYLQLPAIPTPFWPDPFDRFPIPTTLLVGGALLGLVMAAVLGRAARVGASRRARRVRQQAAKAIDEVAGDLIVDPMNGELGRRQQLAEQLDRAREPSP